MLIDYRYRARVVRVVDGDTFDVDVDLGFNISHRIRVRLHGVDTPELRSKITEERDAANKAKQFTEQCLPVGSIVVIDSVKSSVYNRWEAITHFQQDGVWKSLAKELIRENLLK